MHREKMRLIIVDENDNEVGVAEAMPGGAPVFARCRATGLLVIAETGHILLARRALRKRFAPGQWAESAAGTVEEGETYDTNVYKEAEEEIGLKGIKFQEGPKRFTAHPDGRNYFQQWYTARVPAPIEGLRPDPHEVAELKWFEKEELDGILERPSADLLWVASQWPWWKETLL